MLYYNNAIEISVNDEHIMLIYYNVCISIHLKKKRLCYFILYF